MIFRFFSFFILCFTLAFTVVLADEKIVLKEYKNPSGVFFAGIQLEILGSEFGTDKTKIQVNIAGKDYPIDVTYGNQLFFTVPKNVRSGKIFLKKTKEGKTSAVEESNALDIDFKEPVITKVSFPDGGKVNTSFILSGENIQDAEVFCGTTKLTLKESLPTQIRGDIPNTPLQCTLSATVRGFVFDTTQKIQTLPPLKILDIEVKSDEVLLRGDNFDPFQNAFNLFSLSFSSGESLSGAEYKDRTSLRFKKTQSLPLMGNAQVKIADTVFPDISYSASADVPRVIGMSSPTEGNENKVFFEITLDPSFTNFSDTKIYLNGSEIQGQRQGQKLLVTQTGFPQETGKIHTERSGFKSEIFSYSFPRNTTPSIQKVRVATELNTSGGVLEITGAYFEPKVSVKINSSLAKMEILSSSSSTLRVALPYKPKEGDYTISVSTPSGTSSNVTFSVPAEVEKTFYPLPKITYLEYPFGPFLGKTLRIHGEGFSPGISSVNLGEKSFKPDFVHPTLLEVSIPKVISLQGKISLTVQNKIKTDTLDYEFFSPPAEEKILFSFPEEKTKTLQTASGFQDLFSFQVLNTKKEGKDSDVYFSVEGDMNVIGGLPFTEYQIVDSNVQAIKNISIRYDSEKSVFMIRGIIFPVKPDLQKFTLQGKLFLNIPEEIKRDFSFSFVQVRDENKEIVVSDWQMPSPNVEIIIPANVQEMKSSCKEWMQTEWKDCSVLRTRPSQSSSSETEDEEKMMQAIPKFSFPDVKKSDWFYPFMKDLFEKEIIKGLAHNKMQPGGHVTRAELITFVIRAKGEKVPTYATIHFNDTGYHWAKDIIEYALEKGYIKPAVSFLPTKEITRGDAVRMLCKMFPDIFSTVQSSALTFTDVPSEALKACLKMVVPLNIVKGSSATTFSPDDFVTRAEFAKMLDLVIKLLKL